MRKSSKKISMLMVLAMLVSMFSGIVSASAASKWSFYDRTADEVVEVKDTYVMEKNQYANFDLYCEGEEADADTYSYYWESSDPDVVFVDKTNGRLRADKYGKAEAGDKAMISVYIDNKTTKKNENAKRSFYIQIAEDEVEDVEYAVTTKIGDAVLGTEALEAGKDYALTSTVTADGKAVEAVVTYTLDGAAIDKLNVKEGEYTVVVTATIDDAVVATEKYEIVAVGADFAAKATGLKEITVYGNFAKDAKFTVKKNSNQNVAATATVAADGKSAVLALNNRLTKGTYTVICGDAKADIVAEDEKVETIIISEKDGQIFTDNTKKKAYVHYDVLNQYGESVRKSFDVSWSASTSGGVTDNDRNNGILTVATTGTFNYNDIVILTGVASGVGYAASETATMNIGLERNASSVKILGIVMDGSDELLKEIPASFIGGNYSLVFEMYDRAGYTMEYDYTTASTNLTFTSLNPLLVADVADGALVDSIYIDGVEYGKVRVDAGIQVRNGGVAEIRITSTKTGETTSYFLRVVSEQILDEFRIIAPENIIAKNNQWNGLSEVELAFEAIDNTGANITDFRALYRAVNFTGGNVELREQNNGTAKLFYNVNAGMNPTKDIDSQVIVMAIVPGSGKSSSVTLNIKQARYANSITKLEEQNGGSAYILEGNSIAIDMVGNSWSGKPLVMKFADQYETQIETTGLFTTGESRYLAAKVVGGSTDIVLGGGTSYNEDGYLLIDPTSSKPSLTAGSNVTEGIKAVAVEFAIADAEGKILSGSDKRFTFYVVDINSCVGFSVSANDGLIENGVNTASFSVKATLANGKSLAVAHAVDGNYTIEYSAKIPGDIDTVAAVSGASCVVAPDLDDSGNLFKDQSSKKADGSYADRKLTYNVTAKIIVDGNLKDVAKTSVEVGAYARRYTVLNMNQWGLSGNVGSWIKFSSDAYVRATNGEITYNTLMAYVSNKTDNYGDTSYGTGNRDVTVTITKLAEGGKGLNSNNLKLSANALVNAGDVAMIENAEIGDTFVVTYTIEDATHVLNLIVGADTTAKFDDSEDRLSWR